MTETGKLGPRLKALRILAGLSMNELARRSGVHRPTISLLERGMQEDIGLHAATRLARALGVSLDVLVGERAYKEDEKDEDEPPLATTRVGGLGGNDANQKGNHLLETIL